MDRPARASPRQIRRRRQTALAALALLALAVTYIVLAATVLAPVDRHGVRVSQLTIHSGAVGRDLGVTVLEPPDGTSQREGPPLLIFLHGRSGSERTFAENESVFEGLARLGRQAPVVAFPDGGDHGYWHNRRGGDWGTYVMREVIPQVRQRYGTDPSRLAIGGISMGGFGAYVLALLHPDRFCAVGGHSPALWFDGGETAPGAFDSAEDFNRHDVVGTAQGDPDAFGDTPIWNDYGRNDPFKVYDKGFVAALQAGDADVRAHTWPGGHDSAYWNRHWGTYLRFYATALANCR